MNGGAPIQIAEFMKVTEVEKKSGEYQITVLEEGEDLPVEKNPPLTQNPPVPKPSLRDGEPRFCAEPDCTELVHADDRRIRFCSEHRRSRKTHED
jgi:hypothetical protein